MLTKVVDGVTIPCSKKEIEEFHQRQKDHERHVAELSKTQYIVNRQMSYASESEILWALIEDKRGNTVPLRKIIKHMDQIDKQYPKPKE